MPIKKLSVAFWKPCLQNWYWGYPVAKWTKGPYCHSELVFGDPASPSAICFSSTLGPSKKIQVVYTGVRFAHRNLNDGSWTIVSVPCTDSEYDKACALANQMVGMNLSYDLPAYLDFLFLKWNVHLKNARFCSECCADVLRAIGKLDQEKQADYKVCPNELYYDLVFTMRFRALIE